MLSWTVCNKVSIDAATISMRMQGLKIQKCFCKYMVEKVLLEYWIFMDSEFVLRKRHQCWQHTKISTFIKKLWKSPWKIKSFVILLTSYPGVAQLVARLTGGQEAVSSSLATRTIEKPCCSLLFRNARFFVLPQNLVFLTLFLTRLEFQSIWHRIRNFIFSFYI